MILQRLTEYADRVLQLPPEMYNRTPVRWLLDLKADGTLLGFVSVGGDGPRNKRGNDLLMPHIGRSSGVRAKLLTDNAEYALGIGRPADDGRVSSKVAERHAAFKAVVQACAEDTEESAVRAVLTFLSRWEAETALLPAGFDPADNVTFRVDDVLPTELLSVQAFWARYSSVGPGRPSTPGARPEMTCLITNLHGPVVERLPLKIKRIPGGQPSGTALVSANTATTSAYGNKAGRVAPISRTAAEKFGQALNQLLSDPAATVRIGNLVYTFWTREPSGFSLASLFDRPDAQEVQRLLGSPRNGARSDGLTGNALYALALSASGGRAVVRSWSESSMDELRGRLHTYFEAQRIVGPYGATVRAQKQLPVYFSAYALVSSAYRDPSKEMPPDAPAAVIAYALHGTRLPHDLLSRVIGRIETGIRRFHGSRERMTHAQAALLKMILTSRGVPMPDLHHDPSPLDGTTRAAYLCGRLLAELEDLQRAALGNINTTVTDRFYRSACNTPALAFGPLMEGAAAHLSQLHRKNAPAHDAVQRRLEEITSGLMGETGTPTYPRTLSTQQNGVFGLGYYHQRATNRASRAETRGKKERTA